MNRTRKTLIAAIIYVSLICGYGSTAQAEYFNLAWGIQYGTADDEDAVYEDVRIDSVGNIYTMWGSREGSNTTTNMTKLTYTGDVLWTKSEQRNYIETPCRLKIDSQNNYCIFGYTYVGGLVRKYNSDGQMLWARNPGSGTRNGTFDNQGNVYVIGDGVEVIKYDPDGNLLWQKYYSIPSYSAMGVEIEIAPTGEIYLGLGLSGSDNPRAILKTDQNGNLSWTRVFGDDGGLHFSGFDSQGRIVFQVETRLSLGGPNLGESDIALGRCDTNGNIEWLGQYGTSAGDYFYTSLIGPADCIIIAGFTQGSFFAENEGGSDAYIMQIASDGNSMGGSQFGTDGSDLFFGLCSNGNGYYISGSTYDSLWGTNFGGLDIILGKLNLEPTNDDKTDAIPVEVNDIINGWTVGATGTDITRNGYNDSNDVWYYFEPVTKGKYTITLYNSSFDTTLAVFDENDREIVFNDDYFGEKSVVILKAKAGRRYYIRVAGSDQETGDFTMSVQEGAIQAIQGDLNYDGNVNLEDFAAFAQNWMMGG